VTRQRKGGSDYLTNWTTFIGNIGNDDGWRELDLRTATLVIATLPPAANRSTTKPYNLHKRVCGIWENCAHDKHSESFICWADGESHYRLRCLPGFVEKAYELNKIPAPNNASSIVASASAMVSYNYNQAASTSLMPGSTGYFAGGPSPSAPQRPFSTLGTNFGRNASAASAFAPPSYPSGGTNPPVPTRPSTSLGPRGLPPRQDGYKKHKGPGSVLFQQSPPSANRGSVPGTASWNPELPSRPFTAQGMWRSNFIGYPSAQPNMQPLPAGLPDASSNFQAPFTEYSSWASNAQLGFGGSTIPAKGYGNVPQSSPLPPLGEAADDEDGGGAALVPAAPVSNAPSFADYGVASGTGSTPQTSPQKRWTAEVVSYSSTKTRPQWKRGLVAKGYTFVDFTQTVKEHMERFGADVPDPSDKPSMPEVAIFQTNDGIMTYQWLWAGEVKKFQVPVDVLGWDLWGDYRAAINEQEEEIRKIRERDRKGKQSQRSHSTTDRKKSGSKSSSSQSSSRRNRSDR